MSEITISCNFGPFFIWLFSSSFIHCLYLILLHNTILVHFHVVVSFISHLLFHCFIIYNFGLFVFGCFLYKSYKQQDLLTFREHLGSLRVVMGWFFLGGVFIFFGVVRVAHLLSFLCCVFALFVLCVQCSRCLWVDHS